MDLVTKSLDYDKTILMASELSGIYEKDVIFHFFWNGELSEKHLMAIKSCYYFNVFNHVNKKIILWLENNQENQWNYRIGKYAEVRQFIYEKEVVSCVGEKYAEKSLGIEEDEEETTAYDLRERANLIRLALLYKYGGVWLDADVYCTRNFSPLFANYGDRLCMYQAGKNRFGVKTNYPNNAVIISLTPYSKEMIDSLEYLRRAGGFSSMRNTTYESELSWKILPCSWFDPTWVANHKRIRMKGGFFNPRWRDFNFGNFFPGCFAFHWHNQWDQPLGKDCIARQLDNIINDRISLGDTVV
tara:strand:- start:4482 stop:5381 length:900 start_codon:yes stop_codon:yes gene_type:complete